MDKNNANNRVFPTMSVTGTVGTGHPSTGVLFIKTLNEVRVRHIPTTNCRVGKLPVYNFSEGRLLGGVTILFGV